MRSHQVQSKWTMNDIMDRFQTKTSEYSYSPFTRSPDSPFELLDGQPDLLAPVYQPSHTMVETPLANLPSFDLEMDLLTLWDDMWFGRPAETNTPDTSDLDYTTYGGTYWRRGASIDSELASPVIASNVFSSQVQNASPPSSSPAAPPLQKSLSPSSGPMLIVTQAPIAAVNAGPERIPAGNGVGQGTQAAEPLPCLGTWAQRQYKLALPDKSNNKGVYGDLQPCSPFAGGASASVPIPTESKNSKSPAKEESPAEEHPENQAWRWRFTKRWKAEQARDPMPESCVSDGLEEALHILSVYGGEPPLQLSTENSIDLTSSLTGRDMGTLGTPTVLAAEMLIDDSFSLNRPHHLANCVNEEQGITATRELQHKIRNAHRVLRQQKECEERAEERWQQLSAIDPGDRWVGSYLDTAQVDDWGRFLFILVRVRDNRQRQALLVRGRNFTSQEELYGTVVKEISSMASERGVAQVAAELLGGGIMEWRRDRDRHLHLHSGFTSPTPCPGGPACAADVLNLAAVLTRQQLPMTYKVSVDGLRIL